MKTRTIISFLSLVLIAQLGLNAQPSNIITKILKGKIESVDNQIMFATIGIMEANVGTISDENGYFELEIPKQLTDKKLTISHIGYKTMHLDIDSLLNHAPLIITLARKIEEVGEVVVTSKKIRGRTKDYGNTKQHDLFLWLKDGDKGSEIATLMSPNKKIYLNSVSINISNSEEKEFILLLNLYDVDRVSEEPGKQLLKKQKIISSNQKEGWLEVDLKEEGIIMDGPFFVSFQWVNIKEQVPQIGSALNNSKKSFIRHKALGTWGKFADWDIKANGTFYKEL